MGEINHKNVKILVRNKLKDIKEEYEHNEKNERYTKDASRIFIG